MSLGRHQTGWKANEGLPGLQEDSNGLGLKTEVCEATSSDWLTQVLHQPQDTHYLGLPYLAALGPTTYPWALEVLNKRSAQYGVLQDA